MGASTALALADGAASVRHPKVHATVFLVCVAGVLLVLLAKPASMWSCLICGVRDVVAGRALDGDRALAVILICLLILIAVTLTLVLDWTAFRLAYGVSAVVAVNLWIVWRALVNKYGPHRGPHDLEPRRRPQHEQSEGDL